MNEDAPVTRDEINRVWADLKILQMLVAHDVGARWGRGRVDAWYHSRAASIEEATESENPAVAANAIRALDALAYRLRLAADAAGTS